MSTVAASNQAAATESVAAADTDPGTTAAIDAFLKIEDIPGESTDSKHKDEIEILSWSWGVSRTGRTGAAAGAGKASLSDITFTTVVNKASPLLMLAAATGSHIRNAMLTARTAGEQRFEFYKVEMEDILISSYQSSGAASDLRPIDEFALDFSRVTYSYTPQNADGSAGEPVEVTFPSR